MEYQGMTCILIGYAQINTGGKYHMLNIHTKRIVLSHDIIYMNKHTVSTYQENKIPRQTLIPYKINTRPIFGLT